MISAVDLFLSTPSARRATLLASSFRVNDAFLSTPSARRATWLSSLSARRWRISIHALREEGDTIEQMIRCAGINFYPRPPRGGRRAVHRSDHGQQPISIHALREEGDLGSMKSESRRVLFLSTPSARRATATSSISLMAASIFLSTPSARRATQERGGKAGCKDISIHALREEGDDSRRAGFTRTRISIHALREEGDPCRRKQHPHRSRFLSTPSARRATIIL